MSVQIAERIARWFRPRDTHAPTQYPSQPISFLPSWKKGATPGERLREVALIADKYPERFGSMVIVYVEKDDRNLRTRMAFGDSTRTFDAMAVLTLAQNRLWHDTHD